MKYLAVKFQILLSGTVVGMLCPERCRLVYQLRALLNLQLNRFRLLLFLFFPGLRFRIFGIRLFFFLLFLLLRLNYLQHFIIFKLLVFFDDLRLCGIRFGKVNLRGHKGTILLHNLPGLVFITELQAVLIQKQRNGSTYLGPVPFFHGILGSAITFPVNRLRAFSVGKRVNMHFVCHHESRVESQAEMPDNLVCITLVLIFLNKICSTGERNLINILLHFVRSHSQTIVRKGQGLLLRIHHHIYPGLIPFRQRIFPHHIQLLQLCHSIAAVGNQLPVKDIVVGVQPLFDNRKNVFTVDR